LDNPTNNQKLGENNVKTKPVICIIATLITIMLIVTSVLTIFYNAKIADLESDLDTLTTRLDLYSDYLSRTLNEFETMIIMQNTTVNDYNRTIVELTKRSSIQQYDYIIYSYEDNGTVYEAKSGETGKTALTSADAALVFNYALENGNSVYVRGGEYVLNSDVLCFNKEYAVLESDGATLVCNGHKIIIQGSTYEYSQNNQISGFLIINGTVRIENSCKTIVGNMIFEDCVVGLEVANTYYWSECNKIDNVHFIDCVQGMVFRTPGTLGTGSYGSTMISRCYFNLQNDSIAITVEPGARLVEAQMQNVRIWTGGNATEQYNQTCLKLMNDSVFYSLMDGVIFESFAQGDLTDRAIYAVDVGVIYPAQILQPGVTFLGSWTEKIHNPWNIDVQGMGSSVVFKRENVNVPVSTSSIYAYEPTAIDVAPSTIASFKVLVKVYGSFSQNENLTVRFRLGFFDKDVAAGSEIVEKTFNSTTSLWLSDDDLLRLLPTQDLVRAILVEAKVDSASTDVYVRIYVIGTTVWSALVM
jgi:hypothetical protein